MKQPTDKQKAEFWRRLGRHSHEPLITLDTLFQLALPLVYIKSHEERTKGLLGEWIDEVVLHTDFKEAALRLFWLINDETS